MIEKKVFVWEPWFFIAFVLFHLHRIWGLIDRSSYAKFWNKLLLWMFDETSIDWNAVRLFFILVGAFAFALDIKLLMQRKG